MIGGAEIATATAEDDAVRACARVVLDEGSERRLRALIAAGVDWRRFIARSEAHGLGPLVARHLGRTVADVVPADVRRALHAVSLATAARNLMLARELATVVGTLRAAGVPCLPFKGPLVAVDVYGDLGLRTFSDLDVVVPKHQLRHARRALIASGYYSPYGMSEEQETTVLQAHGHITLVRDGSDAPVELHWRFAPECFPSVDVEDALTRARVVRVAGWEVPSLGPEDLLLTLCVHGGKHVWFSLEWVCGVAELLRRGDVDVHAACTRADGMRAGRLLRLGLRLAADLLGAPLPESVRAGISTPEITHVARHVMRSLGAGTGDVTRDAPFAHIGYHLRVRERVVDRVGYLWHVTMLPTPAEWARVRLPRSLVPAYHVLRPIRLAMKYAARVVGAGDSAAR